jgi:hypothetical protein
MKRFHAFGVTCSYDEVLHFKKSAACSALTEMEFLGIVNADHGLMQVVVDNFDTDIYSQNGKVTTHSLAMLVTQPEEEEVTNTQKSLKRISKCAMSAPIDYEVHTCRYNGPKNPEMPKEDSLKSVLPLKILCAKSGSCKRADDIDATFLLDILQNKRDFPEYHGYNTALSRNQGHAVQKKTKAKYLPLVDMYGTHNKCFISPPALTTA